MRVTETPLPASSARSPSDRARTANLLIEEGVELAADTCPATLPISTRRPRPAQLGKSGLAGGDHSENGVGHDHVDPAEAPGRSGYGLLQRLRVAHVSRNPDGQRSGGSELPHQVVKSVLASAHNDDHGCPSAASSRARAWPMPDVAPVIRQSCR